MNKKQLNRMRIMNGLPPVKEKAVQQVEEKPKLVMQESDPFNRNPPYFFYHWDGKIHYKKPLILDPESFQPHKGILTRYGKKILAEGAKYYQRVTIADLAKDKS